MPSVRKRAVLFFCLLPVLGVAGCRGPLDAAGHGPPLGDVERITLWVRQAEGKPRAEECEAVLKEQAAITEMVDWLKSIDWSQPGQDIRTIELPQPDGQIVVHRKDGTTEEFMFYWDGGFIHGNRRRHVEVTTLRTIVQRVCP